MSAQRSEPNLSINRMSAIDCAHDGIRVFVTSKSSYLSTRVLRCRMRALATSHEALTFMDQSSNEMQRKTQKAHKIEPNSLQGGPLSDSDRLPPANDVQYTACARSDLDKDRRKARGRTSHGAQTSQGLSFLVCKDGPLQCL